MKKLLYTLLLLLPLLACTSESSSSYQTLEIPSTDGLILKADYYPTTAAQAPVILLFHQAGFSRGAYRDIAPKLAEMGFHCIAIDQRSGDRANGVVNTSAVQAKKKGLGTSYVDALPDLTATLTYAQDRFKDQKIIVWGSSYSAALVLIMGQLYGDQLSGILSFSPGEYFKYQGKSVAHYAKSIQQPVFITSAQNEADAWADIYAGIPSQQKTSFLPKSNGSHGSKALWSDKAGNKEYWQAVIPFLKGIK